MRDLRKAIIPTKLVTKCRLDGFPSEMVTRDLIYLESVDEAEKQTLLWRAKTISDFALLNYYSEADEDGMIYRYTNKDGQTLGRYWTRDILETKERRVWSGDGVDVNFINELGWFDVECRVASAGFSPAMRVDIKQYLAQLTEKERAVFDDKIKTEKIIFGEYLQTKPSEDLCDILEECFNGGKLVGGLKPTGKVYSVPMECSEDWDIDYDETLMAFAPEFEYNGERYVRYASHENSGADADPDGANKLSDGTKVKELFDLPIWLKVEPLVFRLKNYRDLPKEINPDGNGTADYFDLTCDNIPLSTNSFLHFDTNGLGLIYQNSAIRGFLNGISVKNVQSEYDCGISCGTDIFEGEYNFLNDAFYLNRPAFEKYTLPKSQTRVQAHTFEGCVSLKELKLHENIKIFDRSAIKFCNFNYVGVEKDGDGLVLFSELTEENKQRFTHVCPLNKIFQYGKNNKGWFGYAWLFQECKDPKSLIEFVKLTERAKVYLPELFIAKLNERGLLKDFVSSLHFKDYKSIEPLVKKHVQDSPYTQVEELNDFFKFAKALGCFSNKKVVDKHGNPTGDVISRKACELLKQLLDYDVANKCDFHELFDSLPFDVEPNQDLIKFLSYRKNGVFVHVEMLNLLNTSYPGIFAKTVSSFDKTAQFKTVLNSEGKPVERSWRDTLVEMFNQIRYTGVNEENKDIAELFLTKGVDQDVFDMASELRKFAKQKNIPNHILNKPLSERDLLNEFNQLDSKMQNELLDCKEILESEIDSNFTYEMLDKHSPENGILGLLVSCCASLGSQAYGADIAKATITAPDVQNLVVRNKKGEIISKGTIYVNKKLGYAVINDFELNKNYRNHEILNGGRYRSVEDSDAAQARNEIFNAFMRGVSAFVSEYDKQNPKHPINIVTVGWSYNKLKAQCEAYKQIDHKLTVPSEYSFKDAEEKQYILYQKPDFNPEEIRGK